MLTVKDYLAPIIELDKNGKVPQCKALDFVKTHYHLILNYCTNINMYLLLKASRVNVQNHPIIKRLYQYRQLISQLEPVYIEIIKPQLEIIIEGNAKKNDNTEIISAKINKKKTKKLKLLEAIDKQKIEKEIDSVNANEENSEEILKNKKNKSVKTAESKHVSFELRDTKVKKSLKNMMNSDSESNEENHVENEKEMEVQEQSEDTKRAITYQMAKNKGLTPHRKKEQRNPRVKHRNKFRKAQIRRKGAVREVRKELTRYAGEISGIKSSVTKSVKIK